MKYISKIGDNEYYIRDSGNIRTPIADAIINLFSITGHQNGLKITLIRLLAVCLPGICMAMNWGVGITPILIFPAFALTGVMNKTGFKANFFGVLTGGIVAFAFFMLIIRHVA